MVMRQYVMGKEYSERCDRLERLERSCRRRCSCLIDQTMPDESGNYTRRARGVLLPCMLVD
jgi:hypothetical protein